MEEDKAKEAENRLIEEARMYRAYNIKCCCSTLHTPRKICGCTESFLIDEVAPTSDSLTDKETDRCYIKNSGNLDFSDLGHNSAAKKAADNTAIDAKSALFDV